MSKWKKNYEEIDTSDITFSSNSESGIKRKTKAEKKKASKGAKPTKYAFDTDTDSSGGGAKLKLGTAGSRFVKKAAAAPPLSTQVNKSIPSAIQSAKSPISHVPTRAPALGQSVALSRLAKIENTIQARKETLQKGITVESDLDVSVSESSNRNDLDVTPVRESGARKLVKNESKDSRPSPASTPTYTSAADDEVQENIQYSMDFTSEGGGSSSEGSTSDSSQQDTQTQKAVGGTRATSEKSPLILHALKQSSKSFSNLGAADLTTKAAQDHRDKSLSSRSRSVSAAEEIMEGDEVSLTSSRSPDLSFALPGVRLMASLGSVSSLSVDKKTPSVSEQLSEVSSKSSPARSETKVAKSDPPIVSKYDYSESDFESSSSKVTSDRSPSSSSPYVRPTTKKATKKEPTKKVDTKKRQEKQPSKRTRATQTESVNSANIGSSAWPFMFGPQQAWPDNAEHNRLAQNTEAMWKMLSDTNPMATILNDLMLHQTMLTRQFLDSSKYMRDAFLQTLNGSYQYTTMTDVAQEVNNMKMESPMTYGRTMGRVEKELASDKELIMNLRKNRTQRNDEDDVSGEKNSTTRNDEGRQQTTEKGPLSPEVAERLLRRGDINHTDNVDLLLNDYIAKLSRPVIPSRGLLDDFSRGETRIVPRTVAGWSAARTVLKDPFTPSLKDEQLKRPPLSRPASI